MRGRKENCNTGCDNRYSSCDSARAPGDSPLILCEFVRASVRNLILCSLVLCNKGALQTRSYKALVGSGSPVAIRL
jgi:hypothetical protein